MRLAWIAALAMLGGCATVPAAPVARDRSAIEAALARHIGVLASDDFGGRQPGTEGEAKTLRFHLSPRDMALADDKGEMRISPARYSLWVGGGQPGTGAAGQEGAFAVTGALTLPR